jgi:hypothetical protein
MSPRETSLPLTLSVRLFGKLVFNLSENSSYTAAARGDFPTIPMGLLKRVPVRQALRQLAGDDPEVLAVGSSPAPIPPSPEVLSWVRSRNIAYAKAKGRAA